MAIKKNNEIVKCGISIRVKKKPPVIKSDCYQKYSGVLEKNVKKFINVQPMYISLHYLLGQKSTNNIK